MDITKAYCEHSRSHLIQSYELCFINLKSLEAYVTLAIAIKSIKLGKGDKRHPLPNLAHLGFR
jgi:hypothetical protein